MPKRDRDTDFESRVRSFLRWYHGLSRTDAKLIKDYMDAANTVEPKDQDDRCTQLILIGQPMLKGERAKYLPLRIQHLKWLIENSSQNPVLSVFESIYIWEDHEDALRECWDNRLADLKDPISLYHAACFYEQRDLGKCLDLFILAFQSHLISIEAQKHGKNICWGIEQTTTASDDIRAKAKVLRRVLPSEIEYTFSGMENSQAAASAIGKLFLQGLSFLSQLLTWDTLPNAANAGEEVHFKSKGSAEFFLMKGLDLKNKGYAERAKTAMRRAVEFDKEDIGERARIFLRTHLPLQDVPQEAENLNIKGYNLMIVQKNNTEAEVVFKHCLEFFPHFEWPYCNLGSIYMSRNQPDKAIKLFEQALVINPEYTNVLKNMSLAYSNLGEKRKALEYMQKAAESFPEDTKLREAAKYLEEDIACEE